MSEELGSLLSWTKFDDEISATPKNGAVELSGLRHRNFLGTGHGDDDDEEAVVIPSHMGGRSVLANCSGAVLLAVTALVLVLILAIFSTSAGGNNNNASGIAITKETSGGNPTTTTSMPVTVMPLPTDWPQYTQDTIAKDPASPQALAFYWLEKHPEKDTMPVWRKEQLMALATFYFSTGGEATWHASHATQSPLWLNASLHECNWQIGNYRGGEETISVEIMDETIDDTDNDNNTDIFATCTDDGKYTMLEFHNSANNPLELEGSLPPELSLLGHSLTSLELVHMKGITGAFPTELGLLTALINLRLVNTQLSGQLSGCLPSEIFSLRKLQSLYLEDNKFKCRIPTELGQLTDLESLYLNGNPLTGSIPTEIGMLHPLREFYTGWNKLTGPIPSELFLLHDLTFLTMANNQMSGTISSTIASLTKLTTLDIKKNKNLSGPFPPHLLSRMTDLEMLVLYETSVTGIVPDNFEQLTKLKAMYLEESQLSGTLPGKSLAKLTQLEQLVLQNNRFSGTLPVDMYHMEALTHLSLHNNNLAGSIPIEWGLMRQLEKLYLTGNSLLTGTIPQHICILPSLKELTVDCGSSNSNNSGTAMSCEGCAPCKCG